MGKIFRGIPPELAVSLKMKYRLNTFVETGTHIGRTSSWAAEIFEEVYTIESDYQIYIKSVSILMNFPNVRVFHGFSQNLLPCILGMFTGRALIWLDAHWSKDLGYPKFSEVMCPVLKEIETIATFNEAHVIMIDDVRLFGKTDGFPKLSEVTKTLSATDRNIRIEKDVIIAIPSWLQS